MASKTDNPALKKMKPLAKAAKKQGWTVVAVGRNVRFTAPGGTSVLCGIGFDGGQFSLTVARQRLRRAGLDV